MKIHFLGIGGIGVSALACYYLAKGAKVSGSDLTSSEITQSLKEKGADLLKINELKYLPDLVIYSPAVLAKNAEFKLAKKNKIKCLSYPQALGELTKQYYTIAVSGTHGKSTTTAMLSVLLTKAGLDPTVIAGTKIKEFDNNNCRIGKSKYLVIEADEHFASFLNYHPKIIVLTNIEKDHLDYYKNINNLLNNFKKYIGLLPIDGFLIANGEDKNIKKIITKKEPFVKYYSISQPEAQEIKRKIKLPGQHNVYNALAAFTTARILKVPDKVSIDALSQYQGSWRRFDVKDIVFKGLEITLVSDYGHHPTEIEATLKAAKEKWPKRKIWCVFQPHQYQRTYYLFNDFIKVFKKNYIDQIIVTDIYDVAGRENKKIKNSVNSEKLVKKISEKKVIYLPKDVILNYLIENFTNKGVLIIMGAGDIYDLTLYFHKDGIDS